MRLKDSAGLAEKLRNAARASGKTPHRLSVEARVDNTSLYDFLGGKGCISLPAAGRLMAVLGLEVRPKRTV